MTMTTSGPCTVKPVVQSFEFTKRKRWADTLFSEITETLFLIVSPSLRVLYCSSAVVELLGWKEDQLIDTDLTAFIEEEDVENFVWSFTDAFHLGHELFTYARFKYEQVSSTASHSMLFEIKGHPHCFDNGEQQCFFLSAMPYPSPDIALLNSFLDLKIENERLSMRIQAFNSSSESAPQSPEHPLPQYTMAYSQRDTSRLGTAHMTSSINNGYSTGDDDCEDAHGRKKFKKISLGGGEQRVCVTCGRMDSPEWRKGPHGPKTLCNACGLRWAKRTRKDEPETNILQGDDAPDNGNLLNMRERSFGDNQEMMF